MSGVTQVLSQIDQGDPHAANQLLPLVYDELRKLAAAKLAHEKPGQTLQATALVHEAYLRLVGSGVGNQGPGASDIANPDKHLAPGHQPLAPSFTSRKHFFAAASEAMRRILVEQARRKQARKRGGGEKRVDLDAAEPLVLDNTVDLIALDEALCKLALQKPQHAELVKLRFFAGMTMPQAADCLGISLATAERHWTFSRTWLLAELSGEDTAAEKIRKN